VALTWDDVVSLLGPGAALTRIAAGWTAGFGVPPRAGL